MGALSLLHNIRNKIKYPKTNKNQFSDDPLFEKTYTFYPEKIFNRTLNNGNILKIPYIFFDRQKPETLLFIHGWTLKLSSWKYQMHRFPDYNLLFVDNRGHGGTPLANSTKETYIYDCADDLSNLLAYLNISNVHLISHSMGALISTALYNELTKNKKTNVSSMIFTTPVVSNPLKTFPLLQMLSFIDDETFLKIANRKIVNISKKIPLNPVSIRMAYGYFKLLTKSSVKFDAFKKYLHSILHVNTDAFILALRSMVETGDKIGEMMRDISVPIMTIIGKDDFLVSSNAVEILKARTSLNDHNIYVLKRTTHFPQAERYHEFNLNIYEFLKNLNQ